MAEPLADPASPCRLLLSPPCLRPLAAWHDDLVDEGRSPAKLLEAVDRQDYHAPTTPRSRSSSMVSLSFPSRSASWNDVSHRSTTPGRSLEDEEAEEGVLGGFTPSPVSLLLGLMVMNLW
jgi:hypothetical protein